MQILYDRDWSLTNTKLMMMKTYGSPERVDIRTEVHVVDSDVYLSRATSAFARDDFYSAWVFAVVALEHVLKVLVEVALAPFSNSRFLEGLQKSAEKVGRSEFFLEFLELSRLNRADDSGVRWKMGLFREVWDEVSAVVDRNPRALGSVHFGVRASLGYYLSPAFLEGVLMRTGSLVESEKWAEASHYLNAILLDVLENYVWFRFAADDVRGDCVTLMRSLEGLEMNNRRNYVRVVDFLGLGDVDREVAAGAIERVRNIARVVRLERKVLIRNYLKGS
jgi:hypothetical protein